jgi:hypothetical protein
MNCHARGTKLHDRDLAGRDHLDAILHTSRRALFPGRPGTLARARSFSGRAGIREVRRHGRLDPPSDAPGEPVRAVLTTEIEVAAPALRRGSGSLREPGRQASALARRKRRREDGERREADDEGTMRARRHARSLG